MNGYRKTQTGYFLITVLSIGLIFTARLLAIQGFEAPILSVIIVLAVCIIIFSALTVSVTEDAVKIVFGPGTIRKTILLNDIESCSVVKIPWYHGWGIRIIPGGWLYNVSGFHAVEIKTKTGRIYRVGTNAPYELEQAIRKAVAKTHKTNG